ncbi:MAG: glycosyltransferase involved in cell wall biosynthesis [Litorivivens sp.]|jgi:glycosyltransferase involved in cell wall biosynthesis
MPARDGGCIAMNNVTQGLLKAGHDVQVLTIFTHKHDLEINLLPAEYIEQTKIQGVFVDTSISIVDAFSSLVTQDSYNISRFFTADFDIRLVQLLQNQKFDIIHLESLFMTPYIGTCRRYSKAKIVLRSHNLEHIIWEKVAGGTRSLPKRTYLKYLSRKLKEYELSVAGQVDGIASISAEDEAKHISLGCAKPVVNIPFGIDMADYDKSESAQDEMKVFHLGSMDWTPNLEGILWFLEQVWPKVIAKTPSLTLYLAGRSMPRELLEGDYPNVEIFGEVSDAKEFMSGKSVMIVPLISASGVRVKIIEGMALGKTIVSTPIGAEGIDHTNGENILIAATGNEFAQVLHDLKNDSQRCAQIGRNAKQLAQQKFDNVLITENLIQFYKDLINR